MGNYNSVKLTNDLKRQFVLEELLDKGIRKTQLGIDVHNASYEELKYELVLAAFREVDVQKDENKWF